MGNVPSVPGIYGPLGVCVVASLSPRWGLFSFHFLPTACAVGCILTPLRGSTELAGPLLGRRTSYDTDSYGTRLEYLACAALTCRANMPPLRGWNVPPDF